MTHLDLLDAIEDSDNIVQYNDLHAKKLLAS
jgi:hypothetical protein